MSTTQLVLHVVCQYSSDGHATLPLDQDALFLFPLSMRKSHAIFFTMLPLSHVTTGLHHVQERPSHPPPPKKQKAALKAHFSIFAMP